MKHGIQAELQEARGDRLAAKRSFERRPSQPGPVTASLPPLPLSAPDSWRRSNVALLFLFSFFIYAFIDCYVYSPRYVLLESTEGETFSHSSSPSSRFPHPSPFPPLPFPPLPFTLLYTTTTRVAERGHESGWEGGGPTEGRRGCRWQWPVINDVRDSPTFQ